MAEVVKLRADTSGFLVGDRLGDAAVSTLGAIKADTAAMLALLRSGGAAPAAPSMQRLPAAARPAATAAAQRGRQVTAPRVAGADPATTAASNPSQAARAQRVSAQGIADVAASMRRVAVVSEASRREASARASAQTRGSDGRFGSGGAAGADGGGSLGGALSAAASRAAGVVDGAEKLDPNLEAGAEMLGGLKRVAGAVSPAGRTLVGMLRRGARDKAAEEEKRQTGWLTRIWRGLRDMRRDAARVKPPKVASAQAPAATGGLAGLLGRAIPGAGILSGAAGLLGRGAAIAGGGLAALARGALRRIPLIGALIEGFSAFGRESAIDADPNLSPEERARRKIESRGQGVGAILGTIGGGLLGAIGGPIGIALGAAFGGWLGGEGGKLLAQPFVDAAQWFSRRWEMVADAFDGAWTSVSKRAREGFEFMHGVFKSFESALDSLPVIGPARQRVREAAAWAGERVSSGASWVGERVAAAGAAVRDAAKEKWEQAKAGAAAAISRVLSTRPGANVVERPDGSVVEVSGDRNWRNNNPGNIEFGDYAKRMGAIGSDGRFAIFPDYETGRKAKEGLIFEGGNYKNLSLKDAISRYAPPSENNTGAYQAAVLAAVGGQNKRMADYTGPERVAILDAMQRVEGFRAGSERVLVKAPAVTAAPTIQMPRLPAAPTAPAAAPAPQVESSMQRITSDPPPPPPPAAPIAPSQDVPDRAIAHIATGGIGGSVAHR